MKMNNEKPAEFGLIMTYPCPGVIESIGPDWDWIWIDGQHGQLDYSDMISMVRACDLVGKPAYVRVPWNERGWIALVNDMAVGGIIVPCIDSVEEAKAAIETAKFPPLGRRSFGGRRPNDRFGRTYGETANRDVKLIAMIESPEAIEQADAIASLDGIDGLLLGPDDVMLRRGYSMTTPRSDDVLGADMKVVADACHRYNKIPMMVGISTRMLQASLKYKFEMIVTAYDSLYLREGSQRSKEMVEAVLNDDQTKIDNSVGGQY